MRPQPFRNSTIPKLYSPQFFDLQNFLLFKLNEKVTLSGISNISLNNYNFRPLNRQTNFGNINEALRFTVYYEGKENTQFKTYMGALSLRHQTTEKLSLNYFISTFNTDETEYFDLLGFNDPNVNEARRKLSSLMFK